MANNRLYKVQRLRVGAGIVIGGLQTVGVTPGYDQILHSTPDGADGPEDTDGLGLSLKFSIATTDVDTSVAIIQGGASGYQNWQYALKESGAATWHTCAIKQAHFTSFGLAFPPAADAVLTLGGELAAPTNATAADILANMMVSATAQTTAAIEAASPAFTATYPKRMYKPNTLTFTPYSGTAVTPLHCGLINLSGSANMLRDTEDTDLAYTAMDIESWNALPISVTFRDATTVSSLSKAAHLVTRGQGTLSFKLHDRNQGAANANTITIEGVRFMNWVENDGVPYKTYTVSGHATFRKTTNGTAIWWDTASGTKIQLLTFA